MHEGESGIIDIAPFILNLGTTRE